MRFFSSFLQCLAVVTLVGGSHAAAQSQLGNCPVFPASNAWNTPISGLPVHPMSERFIYNGGATRNLHPDFSATGGIPFSIVPQTQARVPVKFGGGAAESDPGPYPVPPNPPTEQGTDAHVLVLQQGVCRLYELFGAKPDGKGGWTASSGAIFDLRSNALRPLSWTSADAAGLPILPGLVRYDEVASGEIRHALRLTVPRTRRQYVWPARHFASNSDDPELPPMGQRFRLKASYDISSFAPQVQIILKALQKYGLILADNGSSWFVTGAPDRRWNSDILAQLKRVKGSDLEAVDASSLQGSGDSGSASVPAIAGRVEVPFSRSPDFDLAAGSVQSMTLKGDVADSSLLNISDGQVVTFVICQDATGGKAFTWPRNVKGGMVVGSTPGSCSAQPFIGDGTKLYAVSSGVTNMIP